MRILLLSFLIAFWGLTLKSQTIEIIFPNGGEHFIKNTYAPHNIEWTSTGVTNFKIEYSVDNGISWNVVEADYSGGNFYSWISADVVSTDCLIKVSEVGGTATDQSNAVFTISDKKIYIAEWNTSMGVMRAELRGDYVPTTVQNFINLSEKNFYNNLIFHRVISNFMIQDGCPLGNGTGDPGYEFDDEFNVNMRHSHAGILSMANAGPNTNGSQYFITLKETAWLDDVHAVFGRVIDGMDILFAIGDVETDANDKPLTDVTLSISIVEAVPELTLDYPTDNTKVEQGRTIDIDWHSDFVADVKIEFSSDNQTTWEVLVDSIPSDNESYRWTVPNTTSSNCFIKITSLRNPANFTINSIPFEIREKPATLNRVEFFENVTAHTENPENLIMAGKTVKFKALIHNSSAVDFNNLSVTVVYDDDDLVIENETVNFTTITQGSDGWATAEFAVSFPYELKNQYIFDFYGNDDNITDNFWLGTIIIPTFEVFPFMTIDDDDVPDSQGNGNHKLENSETIEFIPKINNKSDEILYHTYGKLTTEHSYINIWNDVSGADGMVYDTAYYNNSQPINAHASVVGLSNGRDFVFDYSASLPYQTNFVLELHGYLNDEPGTAWNNGGTKIALGIPVLLNKNEEPANIEKIRYDNLNFTILNNNSNDFIVIDYDFAEKINFVGKIYDIQGKLVKSFNFEKNKGLKEISCKNLSQGMYFLEVSNSEVKKTEKFMKK